MWTAEDGIAWEGKEEESLVTPVASVHDPDDSTRRGAEHRKKAGGTTVPGSLAPFATTSS